MEGNRNRLRLSVSAWLALATVSVGMAQEPTPEATRAYIRKSVDRLNVDFVIRGKVVDQSGTPLSGVAVRIHRTKSVGMMRDEVHDESTVVNGTFAFEYKQTQGVEFEFKLNGYHSFSTGFGSLNPPKEARIEGKTHTYDNVTVVLQKIGRLAGLHAYAPVLSWSPTGDLRVWETAGVGAERVETKCGDTSGRPGTGAQCVYAYVTKGIAPATPNGGRKGNAVPGDEVVQLVLQDGKGGGFIKVPRQGRDDRTMLLAMTTAPKEGYAPTLAFTAEELAGFRNTQAVYYYFRLNGFFGKGYLCNLLYKPTEGIQDCAPNFLLQPDGTTNVETTSW